MANFYEIMKTTSRYMQQESSSDNIIPRHVAFVRNAQLPPTPGFNKLGPAAQERARQRAKNFYPFD